MWSEELGSQDAVYRGRDQYMQSLEGSLLMAQMALQAKNQALAALQEQLASSRQQGLPAGASPELDDQWGLQQELAALRQQLEEEQWRRQAAEQELEQTAEAALELWESMQALYADEMGDMAQPDASLPDFDSAAGAAPASSSAPAGSQTHYQQPQQQEDDQAEAQVRPDAHGDVCPGMGAVQRQQQHERLDADTSSDGDQGAGASDERRGIGSFQRPQQQQREEQGQLNTFSDQYQGMGASQQPQQQEQGEHGEFGAFGDEPHGLGAFQRVELLPRTPLPPKPSSRPSSGSDMETAAALPSWATDADDAGEDAGSSSAPAGRPRATVEARVLEQLHALEGADAPALERAQAARPAEASSGGVPGAYGTSLLAAPAGSSGSGSAGEQWAATTAAPGVPSTPPPYRGSGFRGSGSTPGGAGPLTPVEGKLAMLSNKLLDMVEAWQLRLNALNPEAAAASPLARVSLLRTPPSSRRQALNPYTPPPSRTASSGSMLALAQRKASPLPAVRVRAAAARGVSVPVSCSPEVFYDSSSVDGRDDVGGRGSRDDTAA